MDGSFDLCRVEERTFVSSSSTVVVTSSGCFSLLSWTSGSNGSAPCWPKLGSEHLGLLSVVASCMLAAGVHVSVGWQSVKAASVGSS